MRPPEIPLYGKIIIAIVVSILVIFSTLGNSLVLCVLNRKRSSLHTTSIIRMTFTKRSVTYTFLVNLSLSDLLHILVCAPFTLVADFLLIYWPFGEFFCRLVNYLQGVVVFLCAFTHVIISIDRLTAIRCPIWRRRQLSVTNARMILCIIWLCAMIIPIPSLIVCRIVVDENGLTHCQEVWSENFIGNQSFMNTSYLINESSSLLNQKETIQHFSIFNQISLELVYNWLVMLLQYILPLSVIIVSYSAIVCQVWMSSVPGESNVYRVERNRESKKKVSVSKLWEGGGNEK
ncbi:RYamide receptor [Schistosoma japonicum]|uniref:RYamide receptor n=1 Tax=Schistosoma japonicum TaxID=6182 RepID=A0A4Z2CU09_SCHJA|nr:RYamide receptor [Schistosoma japonicum]